MGSNESHVRDENETQNKRRKVMAEDHFFRDAKPDPCFECLDEKGLRHYNVMTIEQTKQFRNSIIDGCHETCEIPKGVLEICLDSPKVLWYSHSLFDIVFDDNLRKKFYEELQLPEMEEQGLQLTVDDEESVCDICFTEDNLQKYNCGHSYCPDCWGQYVSSKIVDGFHQLRCPSDGCGKVLDSGVVKGLVKDEIIRRKYDENIIAAFVQLCPSLTWCPSGKGCLCIIDLKYKEFAPVRCNCGFDYCCLCGEVWHTPIKCSMLASFKTRVDHESATGNWIISHTKQCPKCKTSIEKNGGCNHITCRNRACGHHFCWVCMGDWMSHRGNAYSCNRFIEGNQKASLERSEMERFLHFCKRYDNHRLSLVFEKRIADSVSRIMDKFVFADKNEGEQISQTMTQAVVSLFKTKRCLQYTYAFAFHLKRDPMVEIFEMNQKDLEVTAETLSALLEHDLTPDIQLKDLRTLKQNVLERAKYCNARRQTLIEHVFEGNRKNTWTYHD